MALITSWPFLFRTSSSSFANVSSLNLQYNFAETTKDTECNQGDFRYAKKVAIAEEKAGQESEAGLMCTVRKKNPKNKQF